MTDYDPTRVISPAEESLIIEHQNISNKVALLEKERKFNRSFEHKAKLLNLKKQKLMIKERLNQCMSIGAR